MDIEGDGYCVNPRSKQTREESIQMNILTSRLVLGAIALAMFIVGIAYY